MGMPAARLTDMHTCPMVTGIVPHVGGPIVAPGCPTVLIGALPAARITDECVCIGPPDTIAMGAFTTLIGGLPAARLGDMTAHGGVIVVGDPTVLIGDGSGSDDDDKNQGASDQSDDSAPDQTQGSPQGADQDGAATSTPDTPESTPELQAQAQYMDSTTPPDAAAADQAGSAVGGEVSQTPLQGNVEQTDAPTGAGSDAGGLSAGPMGSLTPTGQSPLLQGYAADNTFTAGAGAPWSQSTTGDVFGQVIRGGSGSAPSNPFPLGASENTSNLADPAASDPWSSWTSGTGAQAGASAPPLQGGVSQTGRWPPFNLNATQDKLNIEASKTGSARPPLSSGGGQPAPGPTSPQQPQSFKLFGSATGGAGTFTFHDGYTMDVHSPTSEQELQQRPFWSAVQGASSASTDDAVDFNRATFHKEFDSGLDPEQKTRLANKAVLEAAIQKDQQKEAEEAEEKNQKDIKQRLELTPLKDPTEVSTHLETLKGAAEKLGIGADRPPPPTTLGQVMRTTVEAPTRDEALNKFLEERKPKTSLFTDPKPIAPEIFESRTAQDQFEKRFEQAQESKLASHLEPAIPIVSTIQNLTEKETQEELKKSEEDLDRYTEQVKSGELPYDPGVPAYINGRLLYLTGKTFKDLGGLIKPNVNEMFGHLFNIK